MNEQEEVTEQERERAAWLAITVTPTRRELERFYRTGELPRIVMSGDLEDWKRATDGWSNPKEER